MLNSPPSARVEQDRSGVSGDRVTLRRAIVVALWLVALAAAAIRVWTMVAHPILPEEAWQTSTGEFKDFRDIVWLPGRYVLSGGNPYDPVPYLAEYPWAQQFSAYPPVWLVFGVLLGPLPYLLAAVVFQILALGVAVVLLRTLCRWALPRFADLAVPVGLLWLNIWYPGRGSLAGLGSVLAALGVVLVLRAVTRADPPAGTAGRRPVDYACAAGVALALVKPQFGLLLLVVAIAGGRLREAWRGALGLVLASLPLFVVVSFAAGGPIGFLESVRRNQEYVWGPDTPAGLGSSFQRRFDVFGTLADFGLVRPPGWLSLGVPLVAVVVVVLAVRRTRDPFLLSTVVCGSMLLGFFHPWYDALLLVIPVTLGVALATRRELTGLAARLAFVAYALVVLHLHTVTTRLVPGLTGPTADTIDFFVVVAGLICGVAAVFGSTRRPAGPSPEPARPIGAATSRR